MRRFLLALSVLIAARAAHAQAMKIGYVDVQRAVQEVEEGKQARSRLKAELDQKRANLDQKRASLEKMKADYDKQAPVLSDDAKRKKQEDFQKALVEARKSAGDLQEDMNRQEQQAMGSILQRLQQVVAEIAERESLSFVMDKGTLLYAPLPADITNEVVRRYNDKFGAGEKPAGKAPPKTAQPAPKPVPQPPPGKK